MARYYGTIQGNRGQASRLGTESSGWNVGGSVEMHARGERDTASLLLTGGSNGQRNLGVEIVAFEEEGPRIRYIVRLPGGVEVRGYVGDVAFQVVSTVGGSDIVLLEYGED